MNFTQSFEEFSRGLTKTDLMLYAGIGLVLWVLFKDKLSPVQVFFGRAVDSIKKLFLSTAKTTPPVDQSPKPIAAPIILANAIEQNAKIETGLNVDAVEPEDLFFKLVVSWKETRDLALRSGCKKAVEVADSMFPYLSPNVCNKEEEKYDQF